MAALALIILSIAFVVVVITTMAWVAYLIDRWTENWHPVPAIAVMSAALLSLLMLVRLAIDAI